MALVFCVAVLLHTSSSQLCNSTEYAHDIEKKLNNAIGDKYSIIKGEMVWLTNVTKLGNNPSGIYGVYEIPFSSQIIMNDNFGDMLFHSHDAIVFAGCTPTKSKYYSVVSYLFNRYNNAKNNQSQNWLFASLGSSLNHLLINTSTSDTPFNCLTTVIHTADNVTFTHIYNSLYNHTNNINDINLNRIPSDYFNFAPYNVDINNFATYPLPFDTYSVVWRIAIPNNINQYNEYISMKQNIFYLKYNYPSHPDDNKPYVNYSNLTCTLDPYSPYLFNETSVYYNDLKQYANDLAYNISSTYNYSFKTLSVFPFIHHETGYNCINNQVYCGADDRDAVYSSAGYLNFNLDEYYIVVGVNSYNNNLTLYQNICYYTRYDGPSGQSDNVAITNFEYYNSVVDLNIPTNVSKSSLNNFYLIQFARPNEFIENIMGFNITFNDVNTSQQIKPYVRDYLNPFTKTGPYYLDLVSPLLLSFV
eukprot:361490_1